MIYDILLLEFSFPFVRLSPFLTCITHACIIDTCFIRIGILHPTPRIALFVGWLVTKFQPHHTHMKHSQGLNITDVCTMHICIIIKEHMYIVYASCINDQNCRIMDICITHTCSIVKSQGSWMYASYINASLTYA